MLKENQSTMISGRSIKEILKRFNSKIKDPRRAKKGRNVSKTIKEFLKINCPITQAANKLNSFFKKNRINLRVENNYFPITKKKYLNLNIKFSASFGRELEYYTGMVFKIDVKHKIKTINISGGRYDNLILDLGAKKKYLKLNIKFSASFGRELEYYTGMVFKIDVKYKSKKINISGGRYDNLISDLGSTKKIPAVGAAINLS